MADYDTLFIGGALIPAQSPERIEIRSAATEEVIGRAPEASPADVDAAVAAARRAFDDPGGWASIEGLFQATLLNNGQTCVANSRILVPRARHDEATDVFSGLVTGARVGDPLAPETQIGPLVSRAHRQRVENYIADGKADGARLVAGGGRPAGLDRGWFVAPTLFADVDPDSVLAQEEIFGPVLAIMPYDSIDEAVRIANGTPYGLAGTVWTADEARGREVAERFQSGTVGVNYYMLDPVAPFGGIKASGLGRELGPEGLASCQQTQTVYLPTA